MTVRPGTSHRRRGFNVIGGVAASLAVLFLITVILSIVAYRRRSGAERERLESSDSAKKEKVEDVQTEPRKVSTQACQTLSRDW